MSIVKSLTTSGGASAAAHQTTAVVLPKKHRKTNTPLPADVKRPTRKRSASKGRGQAGAAEETELATLLGMIRAFLRRFVVFSQDEQAVVTPVWIVHTYVFWVFRHTPYLHVSSPTARCGKSLLMECLKNLVLNPWFIIEGSGATIMRQINLEAPTLLFDELDAIFRSARDRSNETLRAILNAGFTRGAKVPRCLGTEIREYDVFCPKVMAGIGDTLPTTVKDRSIRITLCRRRKDQVVERFRGDEVEEDAKAIVARLKSWAADAKVIETLKAARPAAVPEELSDRACDISEPLLAIADLAGGPWPQAVREALRVMLGTTSDNHVEPGVLLLQAIRDVFASTGQKQLPTALIMRELGKREEEEVWVTCWPRAIAAGNTRGPAARMAGLLKPFGISSGTIRLADGSTPKGYRLEAFEDAFSRYLPSPAAA